MDTQWALFKVHKIKTKKRDLIICINISASPGKVMLFIFCTWAVEVAWVQVVHQLPQGPGKKGREVSLQKLFEGGSQLQKSLLLCNVTPGQESCYLSLKSVVAIKKES